MASSLAMLIRDRALLPLLRTGEVVLDVDAAVGLLNEIGAAGSTVVDGLLFALGKDHQKQIRG